MVAAQLAYKCPKCGDWCDRLFVDNEAKRNPEDEARTGEVRVNGPAIGCRRCLSAKVLTATGGSSS
jgi:hypothetical protein